ncbi:sigma-54-dependent Fis family transcriptional regulator [Myxococcus sp. SDU36]|uniref:sigma-54-dependent Fis family transcriptional regulator n=1 Tax=Myxococcus sp. SDU36 TaxID=2831967 RepID=UPI002542F602|nr:sigma-54-dependent Fis family transcriptional regulator [Myxococcus sp. SDU36]WIG93797.1 sigma 54-interacting transcriptional regulator [Myxococcus sp. SDU36]
MRADDLDHKELLELDPEGGVIRFAGQRALVLDAVAMGLLRKLLADNLGQTAARTVLTQFGFAHGSHMAESMESQFKWDSEDDWRNAGTRLHALEGLFRVEPGSSGPLAKAGVTLASSYEAEQHLRHFGRSDAAVCWTISGMSSGYLSRSADKEIYVLEDRCVGKGDAACHLVGRTREEWGEDRAEDLHYFEPNHLQAALEGSLSRMTQTMKAAERKLREHRRALSRVVPELEEPDHIVAKSPSMRTLVDLVTRIAKVDSTVLITGESGSGKERIARLVHDESSRAHGPFIAVNCGAIAEGLLESELFGHVRGAFTGATQDRMGLFEAANSGTLLLDEVGELSPGMQVKLLRALQEREIRRVGENKSRRVDVRVVAATNRNLADELEAGGMRKDLYYRLKVVELYVPPLRERTQDILPLARVMLARAALRMKRKIPGLSPGASDQLLAYPWPGNTRELENTMERAVALARGNYVEEQDLPEDVRGAPRTVTSQGSVLSLEAVEKQHILKVLERNGGNQTRTAEQLQIGLATLYRKLKRYGKIESKVRGPDREKRGGQPPKRRRSK